MTKLFLSHSSADKKFVRMLASDLQKHGADVWVDEFELNIGDSLVQTIASSIKQASYLGVVLSPASVESEWVAREVEIAINEEIGGKKLKILPILIEDCEIPVFLSGKVYADFRDNNLYYESLQKLGKAIGINKGNYSIGSGDLVIRYSDFKQKIEEYFYPNTVGFKFYDDGSGIDGISLNDNGGIFSFFDHESTPTDLEMVSRIFDLHGDKVISSLTISHRGPLRTDEYEKMETRIAKKYSLPRRWIHNRESLGKVGEIALQEYSKWVEEGRLIHIELEPLTKN